MLAALQAELQNDPQARGYSAAADDAARATLVNTPYTVPVTTNVDKPARVGQVLTQAFAPNALSGDDITAALAYVPA